VDADANIPAGYVGLPQSDNVPPADVRRSGYTADFVHKTNASDNVMASSARFSIATPEAVDAQNSSSKTHSMLPVIIAVPVAVVLFIAGSVWFCWFRQRRRQLRSQSRSSSKQKLIPLDPRNQISSSPMREAKPDIEERGANEGYGQGEPTREQVEAERVSPLPMPRPPPPAIPVEETAELPVFITPRSSRKLSNRSRRLRGPAELDINPPSPRPKSFDEAKVADSQVRSAHAARRSKRLSLQQILHLKKAAELEEHAKLPAHPSERSPQKEGEMDGHARRSKRLSLQHFLHLRRVAELEGSSALPAQSPSGGPNTNDESADPSSRRPHRISLHRLLHSRRLAELEANTDILPLYSWTDSDQKDYLSPPALPPKDMDVKAPLSVPQSTIRSRAPIELDASETERLSSSSPQKGFSDERLGQSNLGLAGPSSSLGPSPAISNHLESLEQDDQRPGSVTEEVPIALGISSSEPGSGASIPRAPDAVDFLDLASTESEGTQDEDVDMTLDDANPCLSNFATPLASPPMEEPPVDPFLIAEVISAAVESAWASPIAPEAVHVKENDQRGEAEKELRSIHEMDATESAIKRRSKRQSSHIVGGRNEYKRRPDFVTFKKQMSEAERRAKMIARRRRSRRRLTPKSF
jgi:hypothetical protein